MSASPGAGYKLRPNKAVDRELFLSLLTRLSSPLKIEDYLYIGLGGAFLEDFRLIHMRVGIEKMVSVDSDEQTHLRQKFNKPISSIECVYSTLEDYLDETEIEDPTILWLDYTDPSAMQEQIETFSRLVIELPLKSILRITLNANPSSLGEPQAEELAIELDGESSDPSKMTLQEWRLQKFKDRLGEYCPSDLKNEDMNQKKFGLTLLKVLKLSADKAISQSTGRNIEWCFSTFYTDGQFMVTATLLIVESEDENYSGIIKEWEHYTDIEKPHTLDLPSISTLERLVLESSEDPKATLGYELPQSSLKNNPFDIFKRYYRVFPHFSRIDL